MNRFHSSPLLAVLFLGCRLAVPCAFAASADDNWDSSFGAPGANAGTVAMALAGGKLYCGGAFTSIGGIAAARIAMWDRTNWNALGNGLSGGPDAVVGALAVSGSTVYVSGIFTQAGTIPATNLAQWDGTNWSTIGGASAQNGFTAMTMSGRDLYLAADRINLVSGSSISNLAKWDGTNWTALGGGVNGQIWTLSVAGPDLYVGGPFNSAGGIAATNIAKWDGTNWSAVGDPWPLAPRAIAASESGLYSYSIASGDSNNTRYRLAKWDGTRWTQLDTGAFYLGNCADCVAVLGPILAVGRDLYVTGDFVGLDYVVDPDCPCSYDVPAAGIAKWNGTNWVTLGRGLATFGDYTPLSLASDGSELFVGGQFGSAGGKTSRGVALWHIPHSLTVTRSTNSIVLSWPATGSNFTLEVTAQLAPTNWTGVASPISIVQDACIVTNNISNDRGLYRLKR